MNSARFEQDRTFSIQSKSKHIKHCIVLSVLSMHSHVCPSFVCFFTLAIKGEHMSTKIQFLFDTAWRVDFNQNVQKLAEVFASYWINSDALLIFNYSNFRC